MDEDHSARICEQPGSDAVLKALEHVLASQALRLSERNRRFLSFVVRQTVEGHAERIKAYAIGVDVFGRDEDFDPGVDPIVRIEANRLRTALAAYYDGPGQADGIVITVPRGSYVPTFLSRASSGDAPGSELPACDTSTEGRATIVIHDHSRATDPETELRGYLLTEAFLSALQSAGFKLRLVPKRECSAAALAIDALLTEPGNAYTLDIAVWPPGDKQRFSWRLIDLRTGEVLASAFRELAVAATSSFGLIDEFASEATSTITRVLAARPGAGL